MGETSIGSVDHAGRSYSEAHLPRHARANRQIDNPLNSMNAYLTAFLIGVAVVVLIMVLLAVMVCLRSKRRIRNLTAERSAERLSTLRKLHNDVAGTLTYVVMRCEKAEQNPELNAAAISEIRTLEALVRQALRSLRNDVLAPMAQTAKTGAMRETFKGRTAARNFETGTTSQVPDQYDAIKCTLNTIGRRLESRGLTGQPLLEGDPNGLNRTMYHATHSILTELGNNMLAHGAPGPYALTCIVQQNGEVRLLSSNQIAANTASESRPHPESSVRTNPDLSAHGASGYGIAIIRHEAEQLGGKVNINAEDGEWTIGVQLPASPVGADRLSKTRLVRRIWRRIRRTRMHARQNQGPTGNELSITSSKQGKREMY